MSLGASVGAACSAVLLEVGNKHRSSIFPGNFAPRSTCVVQAGNVAFFPKLVQNYQGALLLLTNPPFELTSRNQLLLFSRDGVQRDSGGGKQKRSERISRWAVWDLESVRELHSNKIGFP